MPERVSTLHVRQHIGELLDRVALGRVEFVIERKGKPLAALVPVQRLEQMRRFARRQALEVFERRDRISIQREAGAQTRARGAALGPRTAAETTSHQG